MNSKNEFLDKTYKQYNDYNSKVFSGSVQMGF